VTGAEFGAATPSFGPAPRPRFEVPLPPRAGGPAALVLGDRTLVLAVVNVTPDSFSDGGRHRDAASAIDHALRAVDEGADLLDVGGESTRPGAAEVPADEQRRRVLPVIEAVAARAPHVPVSIDTRSAAVARDALAAGAAVVNDVSGLAHDAEMRGVVASSGAPAIVMHLRGTPADMARRAAYADVTAEVLAELRVALDAARAAGCRHLLADPGLGFAKTAAQSAALLATLPRLAPLGVPLVVGASRKSFLAPAVRAGPDVSPAEARRDASLAAAALAAWLGAHVVRAHDVAATADAVRTADLLRASCG
jgi:dihydropteroate synthase